MDDRPSRRLSVIVATDVVGYSRLMNENESGTLSLLKRHRAEVFDPEVARHDGRIIKLMGDGALVEFQSALDAVEAAIEIQRKVAQMGGPIQLRFGINLGDVIDDGTDIYGDGVNIAARLESMAPDGGICVSSLVRDCLSPEVAARFADAGSHRFKNIERTVNVYSWPSGAALTPGEEGEMPQRAATVATLPFEDLTGRRGRQHFATGLDEDLLALLSSLDEIRLISIPSIVAGVSPAQAGREFGVDWVLRGSVRTEGERVRVGVQLIDCSTDRTVWAQRFDGDLADAFGFQDTVVDEIVSTLQVTVADGEQAIVWRGEAEDPAAYQYFLSARASYKQYTRAGIRRARENYEKALEVNPRFPAALVGLARTHIEDANWGWSQDPAASCDKARRLLEKAFELEPDHALACAEMAHLLMVEKEFDAGLDWAERATRLAPTLGDAYHVCATLLNSLGRCEDALHYSREAIRRTPTSPDFYIVTMNDAYIGLGRWRESAALARQILARRPEWLMSRVSLALSLIHLEQMQLAQREIKEIRRRSPHFSASGWRRRLYNPDRPDVPLFEQKLIEMGLPD
jgi:adenylate cyclase